MTIHAPRQPGFFGTDDPLIGLRVRLERTIDQRQPCHDNVSEICAGRGPHRHALLCVVCGAHRGWLPAAAGGFLLTTIRKFGVPNAPLVWREATHD